MKLLIGGPTRDMIPADFARDVAHLYAKTRESRIWSTVDLEFMPSTYIHVGRDLFLEAALKKGMTHILWLDTDMSFPDHLALILYGHDVPVVACNYKVRQVSGLWTASNNGKRVETTEYSRGLEAVDYCGMGAMLMRTDVVDGLRRPCFRHGLNEENGDIGEDVMFCRSLRSLGYDIYIDHDLSKQVDHIGLFKYGYARQIEVAV